ncbi:MAG TPA: carboxypeptidase-like regulatory domain-containing protein [Longimicrobiales bacterium]|nr:carboxypeptidase-like regulatory domain-containing protein [Longimicrobiales bacterium]
MNRFSAGLGAFAVLLAAAPALAQRQPARVTATGVVIDASSSSPVVGALVEFPSLRRQSITDIKGRFTIPQVRTGRRKMVVTQLGYRTMMREVQVADGEFLMVNLEPDPVLLDGLNIQVDRLSTRRKSVGVSVLAFDRQNLLASASFDAGQFVRTRMAMVTCPNGHDSCVHRRGSLVEPIVYIDERRAFGVAELEMYPTYDIYLIESYDAGRMIRVYTNWFVQNMARSKMPLQHIIMW